MPTITRIPRTSADDGFWREDTSAWGNTGAFSTGNIDGLGSINGFVRFPANDASEELPVGATITAAYITLKAHSSRTGTCKLLIRAVDEDAPDAPSSYADAEGRTRTTAGVSWQPPNTTAEQTYSTPDLTDPVQAWADRAGRQPGDPVLLYVEDDGSDGAARRQWRSGETPGDEPVLTIEYELDEEPEPEPGLLYRINCGNTYPTEGWESDEPYLVSGSQVYATDAAQDTSKTPGCPQDVLKDHRWALEAEDPLAYELPVLGQSSVNVTLYFSEIYPGFGDGDRLIDIYANDELIFADFDVHDLADGANTGLTPLMPSVETPDGMLRLEFRRNWHAPMVSGIVVKGAKPPDPPPPPPPPPPGGPLRFVAELDSDGDGTYSTDLPWMSMTWEEGHQDPDQLISYAPRASIVVKNVDGSYSPERAEAVAGLTRGQRVRIVARRDSTAYPMWCGWIEDIRPTPGQYGERRTTIEAAGWLAKAQAQDRISVPVYRGLRAGSLIPLLVQATGIYPPTYPYGWIQVDAGETVFPLAFNEVRETDTLYGLLRQVLEGEGRPARLFQMRNGQLRFMDRHWPMRGTASQFTIDGSMVDLDYSYGETVYNRVAVTYAPREREWEDGPYVLAQTTGAVKLLGIYSKWAVEMRYQDELGNPASTTLPVPPEPYTDYEVNRAQDGSGDDITGDITLLPWHRGSSSMWYLSGWGNTDAYLLPGAQQRGWDRIVLFRDETVEVEDAASQAANGVLPLGISARLLPEADVAEQYGHYLLRLWSQPRGEARVLTVKPLASEALLANLLEHSPDEQTRITVREPQTGTDADVYWVGSRWAVGGADVTVEMVLEPAGAFDKYIIFGPGGRSTFDAGYVFGY